MIAQPQSQQHRHDMLRHIHLEEDPGENFAGNGDLSISPWTRQRTSDFDGPCNHGAEIIKQIRISDRDLRAYSKLLQSMLRIDGELVPNSIGIFLKCQHWQCESKSGVGIFSSLLHRAHDDYEDS